MAFTDPGKLKADESQRLLQLARRAIRHRLDYPEATEIDVGSLSKNLTAPAACFVTLQLNGQLRGCIGTLDASNSLAENVITYACAAAFNDIRFSPVTPDEWEKMTVSISVLGDPLPVQFGTTAELATLLKPGIDGVILEALGLKGVFLPQVWETLPNPRAFLYQLKRKAGIPADIEPPVLSASRFDVSYYS